MQFLPNLEAVFYFVSMFSNFTGNHTFVKEKSFSNRPTFQILLHAGERRLHICTWLYLDFSQMFQSHG